MSANPMADLAERASAAHRERERATVAALALESEYAAMARTRFDRGEIDWWGLVDAYDTMRGWGVTGFSARWREHVPYDRLTMVRHAQAQPKGADHWSGTTGWPFPDGQIYPARRTLVVAALRNAAGTPVHIGTTHHFREWCKRLSRAGAAWERWDAYPAKTREQARARAAELAAER